MIIKNLTISISVEEITLGGQNSVGNLVSELLQRWDCTPSAVPPDGKGPAAEPNVLGDVLEQGARAVVKAEQLDKSAYWESFAGQVVRVLPQDDGMYRVYREADHFFIGNGVKPERFDLLEEA
jgi:hypothetical protein